MVKFTRILFSSIVACLVSLVSLTSVFAASRVTVQPGDTLWKISHQYHVSVKRIEAANPSVQPDNLQIGSQLILPSSTFTRYTVQPGDTLWRIAKRYGVSLHALIASNPSVNANDLIPGTTIVIPSGDSNNKSISQNLYWMEHVIHAEASGEPLKAQIAVGDVVLHRMQSAQYPDTVYGVVFQKINGYYQFSCVPNGTIYHSPDAMSIQAAKDVLEKHDDVVPGAYVFFNPSKTASSSWVWNQPEIASIGDLIFSR